ncbi:Hypothetical protein NocV09_00201680 [Nannochloropsis oceanica]
MLREPDGNAAAAAAAAVAAADRNNCGMSGIREDKDKATRIATVAGGHGERGCVCSSSSNGKELEEGLCDALCEALERVEDADSQLLFYKDLYECEKTVHERKGNIAELGATMALVKGEALQHTPEELPRIAKILAKMGRNPKGPELLLKESHLLIKRIVLCVGGKHNPDTIWSLTLPALDSIPDMYMHQLWDQLRVLINTTTTSPALSTSTSKSSPVVRLNSFDRLATPKQPSFSSSTTAKPRRTTTTVATITSPVSSTINS